MNKQMSPLARSNAFCQRFGMSVPVVLAPMAGVCPPGLSAAVINAGGLGACGALPMPRSTILEWAASVRGLSSGPFQINLWVPDPPAERDQQREAAIRAFLGDWGPEVPATAGDAVPPNFGEQCEALLDAAPAVASSIMGLFPPAFVRQLKQANISWWATVTTVAEARAAELAGADVIVAQGMEAGGHRGCFNASDAQRQMVGLFSLVPAIADAVGVPVVAAGGIADARGAAAALLLGASAVQIGTGFLRCQEAKLHPAWAEALGRTPPEGTLLTHAYSGRTARSIATAYAIAAASPGAPSPAPYPVQRALTQLMRDDALKVGDIDRMQAWSGQSAMLARTDSAATIVQAIGEGLKEFLR